MGTFSVLIVLMNLRVIKVLSQQKQSRANKLFIVLSTSDIVVGFVTLPLTLLLFTDINEYVYCRLFPVTLFFIYAPINFSWTTTIVIAIDRFFMITTAKLHYKFLTDKMIINILINNFFVAIGLSLWNLLTVKFPEKIMEINAFNVTLSVIEFLFIAITLILYVHLVFYVRKKSKLLQRNRNDIQRKNNTYSSRTTTTALYVFVCLVSCNVTQLSGMMYTIVSKNSNNVVIRNFLFWPLLALYSSSLFNAIILMCRSKHLKKEFTIKASKTYERYMSSIRRRSSSLAEMLRGEKNNNRSRNVFHLDTILTNSDNVLDDVSINSDNVLDDVSNDGNKVLDDVSINSDNVLDDVSNDGNKVLDDVSINSDNVLDDVSNDGNKVLDDVSNNSDNVLA